MKHASGLISPRILVGALMVSGVLGLGWPGAGLAQSGPVQQVQPLHQVQSLHLVQSQGETETEAEQRIREGLQTILDGLGLFMRDIPRYEAPEILPNGDIIIRRINPKENAPDWKEDEAPFPKPDSTETGGKGKTI